MEVLPRVSVLVVSQAQKAALAATLAALGAPAPAGEGEAPLFEVIVVDCGSPDGSGRLDEEFPHVTVMRLPKNFGWTRAFNIGCRTAKGEFVLHLAPGWQLPASAVATMLEALLGQPKAGAVCPSGECFLLPKPGERTLRPAPSPETAEYPGALPVLYPKLALASMNYFPDKYGQFYADLELFHKMREAGKRLFVLDGLGLAGAPEPTPMVDSETAEADRATGLAAYYAKFYGFGAGLGFWLRQTLGAAASFRLGLAGKLLGSTKVDGQ
ncbi:MAG: glycosyltransferase [Bryobacter sp.]|nr:glycosyltransferase [Bryobacter sp.]